MARRVLMLQRMSVGTKFKSLFWTEAAASAQRGAATSTPGAPGAPPATPRPSATPAPTQAASDLDAIAASVEQRLGALEAAIAAEQQRVRERREARAQAVQTATTKVHHEIKTLEERVAHLRKQLASATTDVQLQDSTDQQQLATFIERSRAELSRLAALRDFIARGGSQ
jgi:hypothetical protein